MDINKPITWIIGSLCIAIILCALGYAVQQLCIGIGAMSGIFFNVSVNGFSTAGVVSSWIPKVAAFGVTTTGLGTGYFVIQKIVEKSKEKAYECLLPILSLSSGFFAQLSQEITFNTNLEKGIYAVIAGAFVCFGGVFLTKGKLFLGTILTFLPILIPVAIFFRNPEIQGKALNELLSSHFLAILGLICMLVIGIVSVLSALIFSSDTNN